MSFPRAPIKRFNESQGCAPPPGSYDPKFITDVGVSTKRNSTIGDKSARFPAFRRQDSGAVTPTLPEPEVADSYFRCNTYRRSSSSSPFGNTSRQSSSVSVSEQPSSRASRCNSYTSVFLRRPKTTTVNFPSSKESNYSTPKRTASSSRIGLSNPNKERELMKQFNKEREDWLEKEHHMQLRIDELRDQLNEQTTQNSEKENVVTSIDDGILESSMKILKITIEDLEDENRKQKELMEEYDSSIVDLEGKLVALRAFNSQLETTIKEHDDQINILKTIIQSLEETNSELSNKIDAHEKDNCSLVIKLEETENSISDLSKDKDHWNKKEQEYLDTISNLKRTLENNHALLLESDERVSVLVTEVENHYQVGREKVSEMENIRSTWEIMENEYIKNVDDLKKKLLEKSSALDHEKSKVADLMAERENHTFSVDENSFNIEDLKNSWSEKEAYYKDTIEELNAKCKDLHMSTMLYRSKLLTMHNTWKNIIPIKQQLLEFKTELSNLLTNKPNETKVEDNKNDKPVSDAGDENTSGDAAGSTKPIVQLVAEIEKENYSLRESISFMQGAIAEILAADGNTTSENGKVTEGHNGNPFLSASDNGFSPTDFKNSNTSIEELLEGSGVIKKALTENIKKRVSNLGLNLVLDDELDEDEIIYDSCDMSKNMF